jgi:hypothetical protein
VTAQHGMSLRKLVSRRGQVSVCFRWLLIFKYYQIPNIQYTSLKLFFKYSSTRLSSVTVISNVLSVDTIDSWWLCQVDVITYSCISTRIREILKEDASLPHSWEKWGESRSSLKFKDRRSERDWEIERARAKRYLMIRKGVLRLNYFLWRINFQKRTLVVRVRYRNRIKR